MMSNQRDSIKQIAFSFSALIVPRVQMAERETDKESKRTRERKRKGETDRGRGMLHEDFVPHSGIS